MDEQSGSVRWRFDLIVIEMECACTTRLTIRNMDARHRRIAERWSCVQHVRREGQMATVPSWARRCPVQDGRDLQPHPDHHRSVTRRNHVADVQCTTECPDEEGGAVTEEPGFDPLERTAGSKITLLQPHFFLSRAPLENRSFHSNLARTARISLERLERSRFPPLAGTRWFERPLEARRSQLHIWSVEAVTAHTGDAGGGRG
jgi:hypothetical protein